MSALLPVGNVLLPLLYFVVFGLYGWLFVAEHSLPRRMVSQLAALTVLIHIAALVVKGMVLERLPMGAPLEFVSFIAPSLMATYLVVEMRIKVQSTGLVVAGAAFLLQLAASLFVPQVPQPHELLRDPGFAGHAVLVMLSYTALLLSFLFAILYLVQARQLDRKQFGLLYRRLPSLAILERMSVGAVKIGVFLMFLSLGLGHLWMHDLAGRLPEAQARLLSPWDTKILVSWIIFLGYCAGLVGYQFLGWRGRRMSVMAVGSFLIIIGTLGFMHHFVPTFHQFKSTEPSPALTPASDRPMIQGGAP